mgnify:CR=1 FL=1
MSAKLKIVYLDFDDIRNPLLGGGQAKTTYEIGKRLVKNGYKIEVISSKYPGWKDSYLDGIYYKHIGFTTRFIRLNNIIYILSLPFAIQKIKADIIVECFTAPVSTLLSPLWTNIPVIGLGTSFEADRFSKLYHLPFHLIEKFGSRLYKYFIAYTPFHENKMKSLNKNIFSTNIPEGVEEHYLTIKSKIPKHILFLGRFDMDQKGIDLLLKSYSKVESKIKYPLLIVGYGPDEAKIKRMVMDLKLEDRVKITGPARGVLKDEILSQTLFVAMPSRSETFSLFTLEALASGLPVLIFDIPGLSWVGNKVCLRAKPFSVSSYSSLILKIADPKTNIDIRRKTKPFAKRFTWEKVTISFENFFKEILKKEEEVAYV